MEGAHAAGKGREDTEQGCACSLACPHAPRSRSLPTPLPPRPGRREKGLSVVVASVAGGAIPWDEASTSGDFFTPEADAFMKNGGWRRVEGEWFYGGSDCRDRGRRPATPALPLPRRPWAPSCATIPRPAAESAAAIQSTKSAEEILAGGIDSYDALFVPGG